MSFYCGTVRLPYYGERDLEQFWIQSDFNTYTMYFFDAQTLELKYSYVEGKPLIKRYEQGVIARDFTNEDFQKW